MCTPENAFDCFINTEMDILVINNYVFYKDKQNIASRAEDYLTKFELD